MRKYIRTYKDGVKSQLHRDIWIEANGDIPEGMCIDHINGDVEDNRLENLRCVTQSQNKHNSNFKGFSYDKRWDRRHKPWKAKITIEGKEIYLGNHETMIDARSAYLRKYRELLGADFNGRA